MEAMGRIARHCWVVALIALLWPLGCAHRPAPRPPEGTPLVRVRLLQDQHLVTITASRPPHASIGGAAPVPLELPRNTPVPVRFTGAGWRVGEETFASPGELTLIPDGDGSVAINGTPYRGR